MDEVHRSLHIDARPDEVIEYIADTENHPAFIGSLKSVSNLTGDPRQLGTTWDWTFDLIGVQASGTAETVEYEPGVVFGFQTKGIASRFSYRVEGEDEGSRLTATVQYEIPDSLLGKLAGPGLVSAFAQREADAAAKALQDILEH